MGMLAYGFRSGHEEHDVGMGIGAFRGLNCFRKAGFDLRPPVQPSLERIVDDIEFNWSSLGIDEDEFNHYVTMDDNIDCYGD